MATRNMRLDKIYANHTKDVSSLRTWDIEGARSQPRIRERREYTNTKQPDETSGPVGTNSIFKPEEYRPLRNPGHFSDARALEKKGVYLQRPLPEEGQTYNEPRPDLNSKTYKDTLEQYVAEQETSKISRDAATRQSMPTMRGRGRGERNEANTSASEEQTQFMKQAAQNNILLKRDVETFFGDDKKDSASGFVRNYNEFYRGSTPDANVRDILKKKDPNADSYIPPPDKKKDVYLYNFFVHKPKYVYTTEERRMKNQGGHYDKFANDPNFKKALTNFFAVEEDFPKPDYSRRKPAQRDEEVKTSRPTINPVNQAYGTKVNVRL